MSVSPAISTLEQAAEARARLEAERNEILDRKRDLDEDKALHILAAAIGDRASSAALAEIASEEKALDDRLAVIKAGLAELAKIEEPLKANDLAEHRKARILKAWELTQRLIAVSAKIDGGLETVAEGWAERKALGEEIIALNVHDQRVAAHLTNLNLLAVAMAGSPLVALFPTMFFGPTGQKLAENDRENVRLPGPIEREIQKGQH